MTAKPDDKIDLGALQDEVGAALRRLTDAHVAYLNALDHYKKLKARRDAHVEAS